MEIKRDYYLNKLIESKWNGYIKVITGLRRCGKSYLLNTLFKSHLLRNRVRESSIIEIALDSFAWEELRDPRELGAYIQSRVKSRRTRYYALIDEIQMCEEVPSKVEGSKSKITFYDVLNGLMRIPNLDIYVTGSNSRMLSDDVATHFRDRGEIIHLYPLTFAEYLPVSGLNEYQAWDEFLVYGGMPEAVLRPTPVAKQEYLSGLFNTLYLKDLIEHYHLKDELLLGYLVDLLMSNVGSLTNISKIADTLRSTQNLNPEAHTIQSYITALMQAYLIEKAERYDVRGRKYLSYPSKYYAADLGLRNARINYRQTERTHLMENVIYNELLARGAKVDVGVVDIVSSSNDGRTKTQHEIDFVVNLGMEKVYIQSALNIDDATKRFQETLPLRKTGDSFRKLVVVNGNQPFYTDHDGISYIGVISFLLDKSLLSKFA